MSSAPAAVDPATLSEDEVRTRRTILKWIVIVSVINLVLFLPLVYGVITGNRDLTPVFGPLHGAGFMIEVGLVGWGWMQRWWGLWYLALTIVTTGPPGALIGHRRAEREALGDRT